MNGNIPKAPLESANPWSTSALRTKNLAKLVATQAGYDWASSQAEQKFLDLVSGKLDTISAKRMFNNLTDYFETDDPQRLAEIQDDLIQDATKIGGSVVLNNLFESMSISSPAVAVLVSGFNMIIDKAFGEDLSVEARFIASIPGAGISEQQAQQYLGSLQNFQNKGINVQDFNQMIGSGLSLDTILNSDLTKVLQNSALDYVNDFKDEIQDLSGISRELEIDLNEALGDITRIASDGENSLKIVSKALANVKNNLASIVSDQEILPETFANLGIDGTEVFKALTEKPSENFDAGKAVMDLIKGALEDMGAPEEMIKALCENPNTGEYLNKIADAMENSGFDADEWVDLPENIQKGIIDGSINSEELQEELKKHYDIEDFAEEAVEKGVEFAGDVVNTVGNIATKAISGVRDQFIEAGTNLTSLITTGELPEIKTPDPDENLEDQKPEPAKTSFAGEAANAGGQAWVERLAAEQEWTDLERFAAKVGMATITKGVGNELTEGSNFTDGNQIGDNITEIGVGIGQEILWNEIGEQLDMSPQEINRAKATVDVLSSLNSANGINVDSALTVLGLDGEIGSTAIANEVVPPETSEASTLGVIGGAIGSYVGGCTPAGPMGAYLGSMVGTVVGNAVGNAIFGAEDSDPRSFAEIVFNEDTGEFEIESSWGKDGMNGDVGENLAQNVLDTLNGKGDSPGIIDQMTGADGQVANGRYIAPIKIGYNDGKYQLGDQKFKDADDMIEKAVITTAQSVLVEDGNTYVQQAVYNTDENGSLSDLMDNIKTGSDFQILENNKEAVESIRFESVTGEEETPTVERMASTLKTAETDIDQLTNPVTRQKTLERTLEDKQAELEELQEQLLGDDELKTLSRSPFGQPAVEAHQEAAASIANIEEEIESLNEKKTAVDAVLEEADPKLVAIAQYRSALEENKAAHAELENLNDQLPDLREQVRYARLGGMSGGDSFDEPSSDPAQEQLDRLAQAKERIEELNDIVADNNERASELMEEGGKYFHLEATDWNAVQQDAGSLNLSESHVHATTSRLNILLENELDIDLDTVALDDLMLEVNKDGSLDIGFRTEGEDAAADVDELTHKVRIDNWEGFSGFNIGLVQPEHAVCDTYCQQ